MAGPYQGAPGGAPTPSTGTSDYSQSYLPGSHGAFAVALLKAIGAPTSQSNVAFLLAWMDAEGTSAHFNPLATTETMGVPGETDFNQIGVKNYPDFNTGVAAEARNLQGGFYNNILQALRSDNAAAALNATSDFGYYVHGSPSSDTTGYRNNIRSRMAFYGANPGTDQGQLGGGSVSPSGASATIATEFPQYAWLLNDPEVGPLLNRAAASHMDSQEFQSELQNTHWWQSHSAAQREWDTLRYTDPATFQQRSGENAQHVADLARNLGVGLSPSQLASFGDQMGRFGWTDEDITRALVAVNHFKPGTAQAGQLGLGMAQVRAAAADYGVNISDQSAYNYSTQLAEGGDVKAIQQTFAQQALARYPHLAPQLNQGLTLRDIAQPFISDAANLLEVPETSINLADPKFTVPLAYHDGKNVRMMTQYEWNQSLMSNPAYGWRNTTNARDTEFQIASKLAGDFGAVLA